MLNNLLLKRKPLLISLDWTRPKDPPMSLGHASIISNLIKNNIEYNEKSWSVNSNNFNINDVIDYILTNTKKYNDIALGAFVWNEKYIQDIIKNLNKYKYNGNIILGGPQISYINNNKEIEKLYNNVNIFIRGTAEDSFTNLYINNSNNINNKLPIKGVYYRGIPNLGESSSSSLNLLDSPLLNGLIKPQPFIRWETQRGCPFSCTFCQHKEVDKNLTKYNRYFNNNRIDLEINWILSNPIINDIAVIDPVFNSGNNYINIIKKLADGKYKGKLSLQAKADMMTDEFINEIIKFNNNGEIILEFGIQTTNINEQKIINRSNNLKKIKLIFNKLNYYNINYEVSLIYGLPLQTISSFQESIKFCYDLNVPTIHAYPLMLLRGTKLYYDKLKYNLIESNELINNDNNNNRIQQDIPHVISSNTFTYNDWLIMSNIANNLELNNKRSKKNII